MSYKGDLRPAVEFASGQKSIKGEDYILIQPNVSFPRAAKQSDGSPAPNLYLSDSASSQYGILGESTGDEEWRSQSWKAKRSSELLLNGGRASFGLFCVMDGHNGKAAAEHLHNTLVSTLEEKMPSGAPPTEDNKAAYSSWCELVQKAIISALTTINEEFACRGVMAGTTVTVVVQCNWLLTVANLGDSRAILDTGGQHLDLTDDHRISTHQGDRRRLEAMEAHIAPINRSGEGPATKDDLGFGPLRVWPGGSCLSRGVGDFDIGPPVIACPYISQVRIPDSGGRVIVASDGVWDGFENVKKLLKISRIYNCQTVPDKLIHCLKNAYGGLRDDTSLVVLDVMPPERREAEEMNFVSFYSSPEMVKEEESVKPARKLQPPEILVQIDVAEAAGLMTTNNIKLRPSWCSQDFCKEIRSSQEAACNAWQEARSMRSMGRMPSRVDLEGFFSAVHHVKPLKESESGPQSPSPRRAQPSEQEDQRRLDITTRPPSLSFEQAQQMRASHGSMTRLDDIKESPTGPQGNASHHFKEHVGQPGSYARKFGLYKAHMMENGDDGSTTEDDSHKGSYSNGSYPSSPFGTPRRMSLSEDQQSPPGVSINLEEELLGDSSHRRRRSNGSFELLSHGSSSGLPTVEEESQLKSGSQKLQDIVAQGQTPQPPYAGTEMAVRRGKNRFISLANDTDPKAMNGRPPRPTSPKQ